MAITTSDIEKMFVVGLMKATVTFSYIEGNASGGRLRQYFSCSCTNKKRSQYNFVDCYLLIEP